MNNVNNPIVFLPGWGFKATVWQKVLEKSNLTHVQLLDLPESASSLDEMADLLSQQIAENSIIVAWSFGGLVAMNLCARYKKLAKKLILVATNPKFVADDVWPGILPRHAEKFQAQANANMALLMRKFISLVQHPNLLTFSDADRIENNETLLAYLKLLFHSDLRKLYQQLTLPVTYFLGKNDALVACEISAGLAKLNAQTKIEIFQESGHALFLDAQAEFIRKLHHEIAFDKVGRCFNRAVRTYDQHSQLQQTVGNKLISKLAQCNLNSDNMIDLGCGTGIVTEQVANQFKFKNFEAIDIAPNLLEQAKTRLKHHKINFSEQDFQNLNWSDKQFDLIFSNMALQWSTDLSEVLQSIYAKLLAQGCAAFTMPLENTFNELPKKSKNQFMAINEIKIMLEKLKFEIVEIFDETMTYHFDSPVHALKSIKAVGANYLLQSSHRTLQGKSFLKQFKNTLTYHIGYFIVRKIHVS